MGILRGRTQLVILYWRRTLCGLFKVSLFSTLCGDEDCRVGPVVCPDELAMGQAKKKIVERYSPSSRVRF
jgi:hypothetical protein